MYRYCFELKQFWGCRHFDRSWFLLTRTVDSSNIHPLCKKCNIRFSKTAFIPHSQDDDSNVFQPYPYSILRQSHNRPSLCMSETQCSMEFLRDTRWKLRKNKQTFLSKKCKLRLTSQQVSTPDWKNFLLTQKPLCKSLFAKLLSLA